jgi:hypothetical protein
MAVTMAGAVSLSVHICVDTSVEPMTGWIEPETAPRKEFTGWLKLVARLADVVRGHDSTTSLSGLWSLGPSSTTSQAATRGARSWLTKR